MEPIEFKAFDSIPRLKRECVITEKIDGTNAQIHFTDEGVMYVGSRNRWITPEDDNYGFARWAHEHVEELKLLGPGSHYGEWWGVGVQRKYLTAERRFSLFNTSRWTKEETPPPPCCHVVPVLYKGPFSTDVVDATLEELARTGSIAAPGFMNPEGIVIYLSAARSYFKVTLGDDGNKSRRPTP